MKNVVILLIVLFIAGCQNKSVLKVELTNSQNMDLKEYLVKVDFEKLKKLNINNPTAFDGESQIPSQIINSDAINSQKQFAFLVDLDSKQSKTISIEEIELKNKFPQRAHAEISEKRNYNFEDGIYKGGYYKSVLKTKTPVGHKDHNLFYKFEGPGWESDLIGYRFYLDWRNSIDIFGKKTSEMVLHEVGFTKDVGGEDSYHNMADWGMDIFKVGNSLGIGSIGSYINGKVEMVSETDSIVSEILDDGPITAKIKTTYYGWKINEESCNLESDISINAGSRLSKNLLKCSTANIRFCTGLAKHENTSLLQSYSYGDGVWNYIALWGNQSLANDDLGIAVFFKAFTQFKVMEDDLNYFVLLQPENDIVEYYFGAVWSGEPNGTTNIADFKIFLDETAERLNANVDVVFK